MFSFIAKYSLSYKFLQICGRPEITHVARVNLLVDRYEDQILL